MRNNLEDWLHKQIILTWPDKPLWDNHRCHWAVKAQAKAKARRLARMFARSAGLTRGSGYTKLHFIFCPPDNRKRDLHNMPATQKASIDGIADLLGVDDGALRVTWHDIWGDVVKNGQVIVIASKPEAKNGD